MNLNKLFEMQKVLDARIAEEKELKGKDLLPNKILALLVEIGELANEWQGFKHWKVNPQPKPKLLEEYVDNLHFLLSIGIERGYVEKISTSDLDPIISSDLTYQFSYMFEKTGDFFGCRTYLNYKAIWRLFLGLGEMLGFTWEQIEEAYCSKNDVNHKRQSEGY